MKNIKDLCSSITNEMIIHSDFENSTFKDDFEMAVRLWMKHLVSPDQASDIRKIIFHGQLSRLWENIYIEGQDKKQINFGIESRKSTAISQFMRGFFSKVNLHKQTISLIAFIAVSTSYMIWRLEQGIEEQRKQEEFNSQNQDLQPPLTTSQQSKNISIPKKYSLILAIPASKEAILSALYNAAINQKDYAAINRKDYEELYKVTQSLGVFETNQVQLRDQTNEFQVSEASEYDMYLVQVDLTQFDPRFGPNQDQMDRYDAFRNLPNLVADIKISSRLTIDVCTFFKLYVR